MKIFEKSLTKKIVFSFLSVTILNVLLIGYLSYNSAKQSIIDSVTSQLVDNLYIKKTELIYWLSQQVEKVEFVSFQKEIIDDVEELFNDSNHNVSLSSYKRIDSYFNKMLDKFPDFKEYEILNPLGGLVKISSDKNYEGEYRANDSYFINAKKKLFVQGVYPSPITSAPTIVVSVPLMKGSTCIAILAVKLNLDRVNEVKTATAYQNTSVRNYLVDNYNMFMVSNKYDLQKFPRGVHSYAIDKAVGGKSGSGVYKDYNEMEVIGAYTWVDELKVAIISEIPFVVAIKPANNLAQTIFLFGFLISLLSAALVVYLSKRISKPILAIEKTALQVSSGDLSVKAPVLTKDEVGILANSFNLMTEKLFKREEELKELNTDLDSIVKERTQELENLNKELESFSYSVSHDLRSPLRSISGFAQILKEDYEDVISNEGKSYLQKIITGAQHMGLLIDEILKLSRLSRYEINIAQINLSQIAQEVVSEYSSIYKSKETSITIFPNMITKGDSVLLTTLLQNLVSNAFKYSSKKEKIVIEFGCEPITSKKNADGFNTYYVKDNGAGFDMQYANKLFKEFQRLHLEAEFEGTGIGLANIKRIVNKHGGNVWAEGKINEGAIFYFTLPAVK